MRPHVIIRYLGIILLLSAGMMLVSFVISAVKNDGAQIPLLLASVLTALTGFFPLIFIPPTQSVNQREGYVIVVAGWILICFFGMLPYALWGGEFTLINAWFESVAGFTTTGSTSVLDVEKLPAGILFWRSSANWLGGIGIILFTLIIVPAIGSTRMSLSRLEISPLAKSNFHYKSNKTLRVVILIYVGLTLFQTILLHAFGMGLFDAVIHTFSTVATGGFSSKNASVGGFNNPAIEWIITIFMFLSGVHFGVLYSIITFKNKKWYKSTILRFYLGSILVGILLVTLSTWGSNYKTFGEAIRFASFQVVSIGTSTGYATAELSYWPPFAIMLLGYFSFQCACAGSTSGGIKVDRIVIFFKVLRRQLLRLQHPKAVIPVRVDGQPVDDVTVESVLLFIVLYFLVLFVTGLALTAMGVDVSTAFSASAATISTVGSGFGDSGNIGNLALIPDFGKLLLTLNMILGRLEIFGLMLLIYMKSWR